MSKQKRDFDDVLNSAEAKDFFFRAEREMFPKMQDSACSLTIWSGKVDAKLALEVGAAVLFNKPIILTVIKGATIPPSLKRIANAVIEIDSMNSPEAQKKVQAALRSVLGTGTHGGQS